MSAETSHVDFPETQANISPLWVKTVRVECWPFINGSVSTHTRDLDKTRSEVWCVQRMILGLLGTSGTSSYNLANRSCAKVNANCSSNLAHVYMFTSRQGQLNQNSSVAPWSPAFSLFRGPWNRPAHLLAAGFSNTSQQSRITSPPANAQTQGWFVIPCLGLHDRGWRTWVSRFLETIQARGRRGCRATP